MQAGMFARIMLHEVVVEADSAVSVTKVELCLPGLTLGP